MEESDDRQLRVAVAEGILSRQQADALRNEARQLKQSPLALLIARGQISRAGVELLNGPSPTEALGEGSTVELSTPVASVASGDPVFPVRGWERYYHVRFLGQGGMGRVFLAFDPRLQREVAIKFVRNEDPEYLRRMIVEARTQARVSHPNVCKVHEVGEVEGKVYIAMQYIAGKPLGGMMGELTVEQLAMVIRGAAEGLHDAHRAGIVHRDIKPSNIMVVRNDDGELSPYVMDFGLARGLADDGMTLSGAIVGTPRYMAPEQARGGPGTLDRRADVYSLGATLYHLLTGVPPVAGTTVLEVLHHLSNTEPRAPRALRPDIPHDLEAIIIKCLEKDRSSRYDSARALADDLGRFLDGEPVFARSSGAWYRLRRRIAKHRRVAALAAIAVSALLALLVWGLHASGTAALREQLARQFTERVERVEAMARYSALCPLHDVTADRAVLRRHMTELEAEIREAGTAAIGPGHYALGRGYLALGDDVQAHAQLESAWQAGLREPRVALALVLAIGRLYQRAILAAAQLDPAELRRARLRAIEQQYREPALAYLAASAGAEVPSAEYVAALTAFYRDDLDGAIRHLDAIGNGIPWFYEAYELRGQILLLEAEQSRDRGDVAHAQLDFEAGRRAYESAVAIGSSAPAIYVALGELEYASMIVELYGSGEIMPRFEIALAAANQALAVLPDSYDALVLRAKIRRSLAEYRTNQGSRADDLISAAVQDGERAVAVSPSAPDAHLALVDLHRQAGELLVAQNKDPSEELRKALDQLERIDAGARGALYHGSQGLIFKTWADYQDQVGGDSGENRDRAIEAYIRAIQADDKNVRWQINLGITYFERASQPRARDPDVDLGHALERFDRANALAPAHVVPYYYKGASYALAAQRQRAKGLDAGPLLDHAIAAYDSGIKLNPKLPYLHNGQAAVLAERAQIAWDRGGDPDPWLDRARAAFERAIAEAPDQGLGYNNLGEIFMQRAWFRHARGEDPTTEVAAAERELGRAIDRLPDFAVFWANLGVTHNIAATLALEHGRDPRPDLAIAERAIQSALGKNPREPQAVFALAQVRGIRARYQAQHTRGREAPDFEAAAREYQRASELAPDHLDYQLDLGHFLCAWAELAGDDGEPRESPLRRGLTVAGGLLAVRDHWPDALVLRARLRLVQSRGARESEQRCKRAAASASDFDAALAVNPQLARVWQVQRAAAHQLSCPP